MSSGSTKTGSAGRGAGSPATVLRGRSLFLARAGWVAASLFVVGLFVVALPVGYGQMAALSGLPEGISPAALRGNLAAADLSTGQYAAYRTAMEVCFAVVCIALAIVIFRRRSDDPVALCVSLLLVLLGTTFWGALQMFASAYPAWRLVVAVLDSAGIVSLFLFFYLFPDGRFVPRWTRWVAAAALASTVSALFFPASPLNPDNFPAPLFVPFLSGVLLTGVYAQVHRYRRVSGPVERQQTKWVVFGFATALGGFLGVILFAEVLFSLAEPGTAGDFVGSTAITAFMLLIPFSIGFAILRYRLFDIDILINRTLVYGALTVFVAGMYVLVVGYLGALFQTRGNLAISLAAAGLVAVMFAPVRDRLQRSVNRLMYGERDDPYGVLSRIGERLENALAPEAALAAVAESVAHALKLPHAAVALEEDGDFVTAARFGTPVGDAVVLPLTHHSEEVGRLVASPRSPGEEFSPADRRLLDDLARQAGSAAHAARLTNDLKRSRERLVAAREEERRRLRRDLHDGLGPRLATLALKHDAAMNLLECDREAVGELLAELKAETKEAIADVRRVVHDLRPPALDQLGLVRALEEWIHRRPGGTRISLDAPEDLPPLPAAVEVAAFRIVQEALTNVARHAEARKCAVRLALDGTNLTATISDDGCGIGVDRGSGIGLASMRERAEELGGSFGVDSTSDGTRVRAELPLRLEPAPHAPRGDETASPVEVREKETAT